MANIKTIESTNPKEANTPKKCYAYAIASKKVDLKIVGYLTTTLFTIIEPNCYALLLALQHTIINKLQKKNNATLYTLESFQIGERSEGKHLMKEVNAGTIKRIHLSFSPIKHQQNNVTYC